MASSGEAYDAPRALPRTSFGLERLLPSLRRPSQGHLFDRLDGLGWPTPPQEFQGLRLERVCRLEEFLQLLDCPSRQTPDVLQIALERRTGRHDEHAIVPLLFALRRLDDFEHADRRACQH